MFCEKAIELIRELHRMSDGQLPAFNVSYRFVAQGRRSSAESRSFLGFFSPRQNDTKRTS